MVTTPLQLQPTSILEWDAEDEVAGVLAYETLVKASDTESKEMLDAMRLELPRVIDHVKLLKYAKERQTPLDLAISSDRERYDFYLIELPLNILVPNQRLVRLRLQLELEASGQKTEQVIAYDLFPNDQIDLKEIMTGEVNLDVSKALGFCLVATGAGAALAPLTEVFGLKLTLPFKWTSQYTRVQTSDRMSNPVEWYVTDNSIQNGFTGHVIIRAPKRSPIQVAATLVGEVRRAGLQGKVLKAQYVSETRIYALKN
ncbi:hypothetical protein [Methanosarcina mazei]|uniref:Uncharacterized protein n=1 Tax=Methanosarcina mazei TaxID=2209 RepID=A0A0F8BQA6_METMZ|nr:hypothetical protein [Methanosarcina mazei]KKG06147.1 hypothetical protein DU47_12885 [Methanosarcina mazei]KKH86889.1 hypothetical protein DU80_07100 [Methanosarcina mazei]